ncbi:hypothetical protein PIB30_075622 [Stylosanthes scabra]|uniref:Uncharacterized protein n=1 Tax=Stylosanthes scabra TaxID=79078 RepID=A0ABU6UNS6_9FABA|nr:hypothetical protein [Stylosanthes scabra]
MRNFLSQWHTGIKVTNVTINRKKTSGPVKTVPVLKNLISSEVRTLVYHFENTEEQRKNPSRLATAGNPSSASDVAEASSLQRRKPRRTSVARPTSPSHISRRPGNLRDVSALAMTCTSLEQRLS